MRLSDAEYADLALAAEGAGLTVTGYVGHAALAGARGTMPPGTARALYREVNRARSAVSRINATLNKLFMQVHAGGAWTPAQLDAAAQSAQRAIGGMDELTGRLREMVR